MYNTHVEGSWKPQQQMMANRYVGEIRSVVAVVVHFMTWLPDKVRLAKTTNEGWVHAKTCLPLTFVDIPFFHNNALHQEIWFKKWQMSPSLFRKYIKDKLPSSDSSLTLMWKIGKSPQTVPVWTQIGPPKHTMQASKRAKPSASSDVRKHRSNFTKLYEICTCWKVTLVKPKSYPV